MNTERILGELREERERLDRAIAALSSGGRGGPRATNGRPAKHMSAAARKRISEAMKARWASGKMKGNRKRKAA